MPPTLPTPVSGDVGKAVVVNSNPTTPDYELKLPSLEAFSTFLGATASSSKQRWSDTINLVHDCGADPTGAVRNFASAPLPTL